MEQAQDLEPLSSGTADSSAVCEDSGSARVRGSPVIAAAYDAIAGWYDAWAGEAADDPFFGAVDALLGDLAGLRVCELACGQGRIARRLARRGARVVGVDLSARLLEIAAARERAEPRAIGYVLDDAQGLAAIRDGAFDGVVCHMALMDIPELAPTLGAVARVLRPGGWFAFATFHPCFNAPDSREEVDADAVYWRMVRDYWTEGYWRSDTRAGPPGKVGAYHRTLATLLNGLTDAGLALERVAEPRAAGRLAAARPVWNEVPAVFVAVCRKPERC
jgi:2-polyprenyl-3-methyl-5-hydroxy-6-metoxy-1,4-benzoquinol methylase